MHRLMTAILLMFSIACVSSSYATTDLPNTFNTCSILADKTDSDKKDGKKDGEKQGQPADEEEAEPDCD
jgi:hypothetical protein